MKYCRFCVQNYKTEKHVCPKCGGYLVESIDWNYGIAFVMFFMVVMIGFWGWLLAC